MQLREDLLTFSQEHEDTMQQNFQFTVENEDLRDRLHLIGHEKQVSIDYLPYIAPLAIEKLLEEVKTG